MSAITDVADTKPHLSVHRLMWRRFRRNRVALVSSIILFAFYIIITFAGFFSPYAHDEANDLFATAPPQVTRFFDEDGNFISAHLSIV